MALVGQGVELGNAQEELKTFLEKADIPAGRTLMGLSALPSNHPLNMGMLGMHGSYSVNLKEQEADVLIAIGMRFSDRVTGNLERYAKQAKIIHLDIDRSEIDLLVFISQTPDYRMPATSITLQHRLGLSNTCIAFDINLGCSAFLYGMSVVYSMMQTGNIRKALILDGETRSKVYGPKDRRSAFIFGDGGVAALVERNEITF